MVWHDVIKNDRSKIIDFIEFFEKELIKAKDEIEINGLIEKCISSLPGIVEIRAPAIPCVRGPVHRVS